MHNSVSFNITSNITDEGKLKERLREIHDFLTSKNVHSPVSHIDGSTGSCHIDFFFGNEQVPMHAILSQRNTRGRFKVSIGAKETTFNLSEYCARTLGKTPKEVFHEMIDHLLKVSTQKPEKMDDTPKPTTASPNALGTLLGIGAEEGARLALSTPKAQKHMSGEGDEEEAVNDNNGVLENADGAKLAVQG